MDESGMVLVLAKKIEKNTNIHIEKNLKLFVGRVGHKPEPFLLQFL